MRFDYVEREVDPLPGESGIQIVTEPIIVVRSVGPKRTYLIRSLLDTGASMTLVPRSFMSRLGLAATARAQFQTAAGPLPVELATLDLELGTGRTVHRWSARVGFVPRADNLALLGHAGFLDHFAVTFDGLVKRVTLRPNGTFPPPNIPQE